MIPGEIIVPKGEIELNADRPTVRMLVGNTGDRPIQVGSHYHFYEANEALEFNREQAKGMRLDIPAGTAVRFEPGDEREVQLVPFVGSREVYGFNKNFNGIIDIPQINGIIDIPQGTYITNSREIKVILDGENRILKAECKKDVVGGGIEWVENTLDITSYDSLYTDIFNENGTLKIYPHFFKDLEYVLQNSCDNTQQNIWGVANSNILQSKKWILNSGTSPDNKRKIIDLFKETIESATKYIDILIFGGIDGKFKEILQTFLTTTSKTLTIRIFSGLSPEFPELPSQEFYISLEIYSKIKQHIIKPIYDQLFNLMNFTLERAYNLLIDLFGSDDNGNCRNIPSNITVYVGAGKLVKNWTSIPIGGWEHSKLIVVDGKEVLTGGMNFIPISLNAEEKGETREDTVHDLLVRLQGDAAKNAQLFINAHWKRLNTNGTSFSVDSSKILKNNKNIITGNFNIQFDKETDNFKYYFALLASNSQHLSKAFEAFVSLEKSILLNENIKIITIGRRSGYDYPKEASDIALIKLIELAKNTLYISQQALFYPTNTTSNKWSEIIKAICDALVRNVNVKILLSRSKETNAGSDGGYNSMESCSVRNEIMLHLNPTLSYKSILSVCNLKTQNGTFARNHAKVIITDEKAVYVGSQNLYPNRRMIMEANLGEFGLIIFDKNKVQELVESYWEPLWTQSIKGSNNLCNDGQEILLDVKDDF